MRRLSSSSPLACPSPPGPRLAFAALAALAACTSSGCGSRSEPIGVLGGNREATDDAGVTGHGLDGSALDDGSLDDSALADADRGDSGPPNPCGGYQAYAPWPAFQRCSAHIGRTEAIGPRNPTIKWQSQVGVTMPLGVGVVGPPTIAADGTIYVANLFGQVVAFAPDGSTSWASQVTYIETGPSAVAVGANGSLYVELDQLYALTSSGGSLWTAPVLPGVGASTIGPAPSSGTVSQNGTLYVGTSAGLVSLTTTGSASYANTNEEQGWTPAINTSDVVYSADATGNLIATGPDGATLWSFAVPPTATTRDGWIQTSPVIAEDGTLYFGAVSGFFAMTPKGTVRWQLPWTATPPPQTTDTMAIGSDGSIYLISPDATLSAISPKGDKLWSLPVAEPGSPPVIDGNGTIYLIGGPIDGGDDGVLLAVTPKGEIAWELTLTKARGGALAIGSDGTIYASTYPTAVLFAIGNAN